VGSEIGWIVPLLITLEILLRRIVNYYYNILRPRGINLIALAGVFIAEHSMNVGLDDEIQDLFSKVVILGVGYLDFSSGSRAD